MSIALGMKLADLRKKNGYSQEALAENLGVSRQAVSEWERGESSPDADTLIELSRLYSVSLDELAGNGAAKAETNTKNATEPRSDKPLYPGLSSKLMKFPFPLLIVAVYLVSGFTLHLWHPLWMLFLLIPAYYHLALATKAKTKKGLLMGMPVIEAALILFLLIGFALNGWSWAWILFIIAVYYYWHVGMYVKKE